jgi:hypothetical protein
MASITWTPGPLAWAAGFAAADLNSLANVTQKTSSLASPQIDNSGAAPDMFVQFEVVLASLTPVAAGNVLVVCVPLASDGGSVSSTDGTGTGNQVPWQNYPHAAIALRTGAGAQVQQSPPISLPPGQYRLALINRAGVALAASGNMVSWRKYSEAVG